MRRTGWGRRLAVLYLAALLLSHLVWWAASVTPPEDGELVEVFHPDSTDDVFLSVPLSVRQEGPTDGPAVLLLHGSPGRKTNFAGMVPPLAAEHRTIVPDLSGFGDSSSWDSDLSMQVQAGLMLSLLDQLDIEQAHVVGYSLGGGIALQMWAQAPERIASLVLLSSIGVQEMELLGDYHLNHGLHQLQTAAVFGLLHLVPHFGAFDSYAKDLLAHALIFSQSDQRPLRGILRRYDGPMLVIHGETDFLVPPEAAVEHARLVPQAELQMLEQGHFMVFEQPDDLAARIGAFVSRVESGQALLRSAAAPDRVAAAARPFDPTTMPPAHGPFLVLLLVLIALATLISEDLTCIGAGLLAAAGRITFLQASAACIVGIFVGDIALFLAGRTLGRGVVSRRPLKWFLSPERVVRAEKWFKRRGLPIVFASRFMPGLRLPTYFAAGVLGTSLLSFSACFLLAAMVWTPLLVGLSMAAGYGAGSSAGSSAGPSAGTFLAWGPWAAVGLFVLLVLVVKVGVPACSHRGRRLLRGRWLRWTRWEFWPPWLFYPPIVCWIAWLACKHRSLTLMTAANPAIPTGGFVGESKAQILSGLLDGLRRTGGPVSAVARCELIPAALDADERLALALSFLRDEQLPYPVVLKPDVGERGAGVSIVADADELAAALTREDGDRLLQEHVPGIEVGVFYVRMPGERGRLLSITDKRMPTVTGDGRRTLEELILDDDRAVAMASVYCALHAERLLDVPPAAETVRLAELGTHCRGAVFLDGHALNTPALEQAIETLSKGFDGFCFGRYDIRAPSREHVAEGRGLKVIELNGLTSEATHIYDPRHGLFAAWRTLAGQWSLAFSIAAANRTAGARPSTLRELLAAVWAFSGRRGSAP